MGNSHAWWYARTTLSHDKVLWVRKPHTAAKHSILRHYLEAWFPKLAWTSRVFFVDGFAGPGEYAGGEPGSPIIALNAAVQHKGDLSKCELLFMFVERGWCCDTRRPEGVSTRSISRARRTSIWWDGLRAWLRAVG